MKIKAFLFTCERDRHIAEVAAEMLRWQGIPAELLFDGVDTHFPRGGNLNGEPCIRGMHSEMFARSEGFDAVLKVDSDTLVTPLAVRAFRASLERGYDVAGYKYASPTSGAAYLIRRSFFRVLARQGIPVRHEDKALYRMSCDAGYPPIILGVVQDYRPTRSFARTAILHHHRSLAKVYAGPRAEPEFEPLFLAKMKENAEAIRKEYENVGI